MKTTHLLKRASEILSICIFLAGLTVLAGWILDIPSLKSVLPKFVTMKANTAVCFILIGLSFWLSQEKRLGNRSGRGIAWLCALIVFLIGFLTFWEYLLNWDLGIDQILFKEPATAILTSSPGRMAFNTAINFILIGIVLFMAGAKTVFFSYLAQFLVIPVGIISLLSFVGYLYGASPLYLGPHFSTAMALHTTVLFIMAYICYLFSSPEQGMMKNISSRNSGGIMIRRILPVIIFLPLFLGWFKIFGEKAGLFTNAFGVSLVLTLNLLVISLAGYILSIYLNRLDTKRQKAEDALRESEVRYKTLFFSAAEGIAAADLQTKRYCYVNPTMRRIFGYTDEEFTRLGVADIHPKESLDHVLAEFEAQVRGEKTLASGLPCLRKDGTLFYANVSATSMVLDGRKCLVGFFTDITERKKAEGELKAAYKDLKEAQSQLIQSSKMSALGQLAGGVAHELNNPLTGVLNNVQLIKMEAEGKRDFKLSDFKELLDIVEASAVRCKKITQSLLDFTHIAKGEFSPLFLNEIAEKTVDLVLQELKLQNVTFQKELHPDLPRIQGDPQLLQQAVFGLIVNAKWAIEKKSAGGGVITIKTGYDPKGKVATLSISDTGIGIPQENFHKLFTPFFTTKGVGEGTGLGLALLYNIIESHHGRIDVESEVGIGTTFKISLPCV